MQTIKNYKQKIILLSLALMMFFSFSSNVFAGSNTFQNGSACTYDSECVSGSCEIVAGNKVCIDPTAEADLGIAVPEFKSPTTTQTFEDLVCSATTFISGTIIPPVAVLMTLIVGFLYLVSWGSPEKVSNANKVLLFTIVGIFIFLLSPGIVSLTSSIFGTSSASTPACSGSGSGNIIANSLINLVNWMGWFIALVSILSVLYSGFLYMTSSGDSEKTSKATKIFIFAIIGVAVSILAFSVISIVETFI